MEPNYYAAIRALAHSLHQPIEAHQLISTLPGAPMAAFPAICAIFLFAFSPFQAG
jgi:hypothetical protein